SCFFLMPFFFFSCYGAHPDLHSFPTRRSSDLAALAAMDVDDQPARAGLALPEPVGERRGVGGEELEQFPVVADLVLRAQQVEADQLAMPVVGEQRQDLAVEVAA